MTGSMRIAYLTSQYPASSHTFIRREVEAMRRAGLDATTFSIRSPSSAEMVVPKDRISRDETFYVLEIPTTRMIASHLEALFIAPRRYVSAAALALRHRVPGIRALIWALFHFVEAIALAVELRRRRVDHVHNHFANSAATVGLLAAHYLRLPWSMTLHGISETDYPAGVLLPAKVKAAAFVACVSWFGRAQALRFTDADQWDKLSVVRCGVEINQLPVRQIALHLPTAPVIACVARLSPEKGHLGLLEAIKVVVATHPALRLILVGDGPERASIEGAVAALRLQEHVTLLGRLDEQATLDAIASADLLVLPSFMEGLPVVLMEAMAQGVGVVATRVAGVPELIVDGKEGLLFTPGRWDELASQILRALADWQATHTRIQCARAKIEREFAIESAVAPLLALYARQSKTN